MGVYKIGNHNLVLGLSWLPPDAIPASARESRQNRYLTSLKPTPQGYVSISPSSGTQFGTTVDAQDIGLESAAAWLAQNHPSIVVVEKLDDENYWLCAIEDGAIFPAGDVIGQKDLITSRFEEVVTDIAGTDIRLCSNVEFATSPKLEHISFAKLIAGSSPTDDIRCVPIYVRNKRRPVIAALVVVALCIYPAWQLFLQSPEPVAEVDSGSEQALQNEIDHFNELLNQNSSALLATFADAIHNRPLRAAGWQNTSYEWKNGVANAFWTRGHGDLASITEHLRERDFELIEKSGVVVERFEFPAVKRSETNLVDEISGGPKQRYQLIDMLAQMPGKWALGKAQEIGSQYRVNKSPLKGSSKRLATAILFAKKIRNQPFIVERIEVELGSSFAWEIEGQYYAKVD